MRATADLRAPHRSRGTRPLQSQVDMLVGDIYGERDYSAIGLSATTIASSFGKVVSQDRDLEAYDPADIAMALCRMVRPCHRCARGRR